MGCNKICALRSSAVSINTVFQVTGLTVFRLKVCKSTTASRSVVPLIFCEGSVLLRESSINCNV